MVQVRVQDAVNVGREDGTQFREETRMPPFVEGLCDIQEGSSAVLSCFVRLQDGVDYVVYLLYGGMFPPKAKLMVG